MTDAKTNNSPLITIVRNEQAEKADKLEDLFTEKQLAYREESAAQVLEQTAKGREPGQRDVVLVIAPVYEEKETLELCAKIRDSSRWANSPLLVAVNMYQMPLANRVKEMENADFIFTPPEAKQVLSKLEALTGTPLTEEANRNE